jgi:Spy/CpxP family protein refolding chaperone
MKMSCLLDYRTNLINNVFRESKSKDSAIMNKEMTLRSGRVIVAAIALLAGIWLPGKSQSPTPQQPDQAQSQPQISQATTQDVFGQLELSPEQVQKIRAINAELKDQRQAANQRLRLAQRALAEAVESSTPNETLIDQRSREVADAQSSVIRFRSLTESRVLQVLTPEQRARLREIRQRNQALRREAAQQGQGNGLRPRQRGLQRNGNAQTGSGPNQRRLMRRPQRR